MGLIWVLLRDLVTVESSCFGTWVSPKSGFVGVIGSSGEVGVGAPSGLMTTTFWSVMISSAESSRDKLSGSSSSSAKNSKVLALKARANLENISEIGGALEEPSISSIGEKIQSFFGLVSLSV